MSDVMNEEIGDEPAGGGTASSNAMGNHLVGSPAATDDPAIDEDVGVGAVAAEFVLGTLDSGERARANTLLASDPHFRGMVGVWERRLGELHLMVEPVDPPPPIWESIKGKLKGVEQSPGAVRSEGEPAVSVEKTRATLEALEAQLREEGLDVPPTAAEAQLPALAATRTADWVETSDPQASATRTSLSREAKEHPDGSARSIGAVATLMTLIALALAGLIAAWRYFPDRLPPQLRAENVLNIHPAAPPPPPAPVRPSAPPESQFDE
jgi:anti-sigma-K factor RskA